VLRLRIWDFGLRIEKRRVLAGVLSDAFLSL